jgi:hypothetical protein
MIDWAGRGDLSEKQQQYLTSLLRQLGGKPEMFA